MVKITHRCGADLEWIKDLTHQIGGKIEGNFIIYPKNISTGVRFFLECEPGIVAYYMDVTYHTEILLCQKNKTDDHIALYYNLSEGDIKLSSSTFNCSLGRWSHDMVIMDGSTKSQYEVKKESKTLALFIYIKKTVIKSHFKQNKYSADKINLILGFEVKPQIKTHKMNHESIQSLYNLRRINTKGILFELNLIATVNLLINDYLTKLTEETEILQHINEIDLLQIILSQKFLLENLDFSYPGNNFIAEKANMSKSKFMRLFKKINNDTPCNYFITHKLIKSKEMLTQNCFSVAQIAEKLHLNTSHFCSIFKCFFGISPKSFIKQIQNYDHN